MNVSIVSILLLSIAITLVLADWLAKQGLLPLAVARKLLHVVGVGACTLAMAFFHDLWLLKVIIAGFALLLLIAVHYNWISLNKGARKSWGIAIFPVAFLVLLALFGQSRPWLVIYPMAILTLADAAAAVAGELYAKRYFNLSADKKSWFGSSVFVGVSFLLLVLLPSSGLSYFFLPSATVYTFWQWLAVAFLVSVVLALVEASCSSGFDNLALPLGSAWLLLMVLNGPEYGLYRLPTGLLLAAIFAFLSFKKGWLDAGGAAVAAILGITVWMAGKWQLTLPMLVFFAAGSLLGKINAKSVVTADSKHHKPRDWQQVICNGGVAGFCLLVYQVFPNPAWLLCYWLSIAISLADTTASEIGMRFGGTPVDIMRLRRVPAGISGGVSLAGTIGALCGGICIAALALQVGKDFGQGFFILIATGGFAGMLLDSAIGSLMQARYIVNGRLSEFAGAVNAEPLEKGFSWMSNDLVNLLSNLFVTLAGYFLAALFL